MRSKCETCVYCKLNCCVSVLLRGNRGRYVDEGEDASGDEPGLWQGRRLCAGKAQLV